MRAAGSLVCALGAAAIASAGAAAQDYPTRALRIVVPEVAGGMPDFVIRPIAQRMAASLRQGVSIDNRPGAGGVVGVEWAARGAPDGYALLFGGTSQIVLPVARNARLAYDVGRDLSPITLLAEVPYALCAHPSLPAKSLRDLVALARKRPGQIDYASPGRGSLAHLLMEAFGAGAGMKLAHVPEKAGAPAAAALLAGEVMVSFETLRASIEHVRAQRLRALAVGAAKRVATAPEVPTFAEAGFAGFGASAWYGLFAPINTPQDVIARLNAEAVKALAQPDVRERLERAGIDPVGSAPERLAQQLRDDIVRFGRIAKDAGLRSE